jgi:hypothetical protein
MWMRCGTETRRAVSGKRKPERVENMSESSLNFWLFTALCIIAAWGVRKVYQYIHEMKEMIADIWWNSEKLVAEWKIEQAETLVTSDRPTDWYMENVRHEIDELTGGK